MPQKRSEQQKVVRSPVFEVLNKRKGVLAGAAFKAKLHHPDELHVFHEAVVNRKAAALRRNHVVTGGKKGFGTLHALLHFVGFPALHNLGPQKCAEHKGRGNLFAGGDALIRAL